MITDKLIETVSKSIKVENILESDDSTDYLITVLFFRNREVFRHSLNLRPLYESFKNRLDSEE